MKRIINLTLLLLALPLTATASSVTVNGINYYINGNNATIDGPENPDELSGDIIFPASINYNGNEYPVTTIDGYAFLGCDNITSVTIPNSITYIGMMAFHGCTALSTINMGHSIPSIDLWAFFDTALYNNHSDGLIYIGQIAYFYKGTMPAETSITLRDGTLGIAAYAFIDCGSSLINITIPQHCH